MFKQLGAIDLQFQLEPTDEDATSEKMQESTYEIRRAPRRPERKPCEVRVANSVIGRICGQAPGKGESAKTRCHAIRLAFIKALHEQGHPGGFAPNRQHFEAQGYGFSEWAFESAVRWNDRALDLNRRRAGKHAAEEPLSYAGGGYVAMPLTALRLPSRVFAFVVLARLSPRPRTPAEIGRILGIADRHTATQIAREAAQTGLVTLQEGARGKIWIGRLGSAISVETRQVPEQCDLSRNHTSKNHLSKNHGTQSYRKNFNLHEGKESGNESAPRRRGAKPTQCDPRSVRRTSLDRQAEVALRRGADPVVVSELASPLAGLPGKGDPTDWLCELSSCLAESGPFEQSVIKIVASTARRIAFTWRPSPQECARAAKRVSGAMRSPGGLSDPDRLARFAWGKEGSTERTARITRELAERQMSSGEAGRTERPVIELCSQRWALQHAPDVLREAGHA